MLAAGILPLFMAVASAYALPDTVPLVSKSPEHSLIISTGVDYAASSMGDDLQIEVPEDEKVSVHTAVPVHFKYAFSFRNPKIRNYYPGGYQGIGLGLINFGALEPRGMSKSHAGIGYPVSLYIFQGGPVWRISRKLNLNYEWNFGAAFGWKTYSPENYKFNLRVGSRVNAYLNIGFNLEYAATSSISLFAGIAVSHYSNGNTSWPNPGVNTMGIRMGLSWYLNGEHLSYPEAVADTLPKRRLKYDISLWGASRKRVYRGGEEPVLLPGHYGCAGISFSPMYQLKPHWRIGGALDIQWDGSSDKKSRYIGEGSKGEPLFRDPDFLRQMSWGISAHAELVMPIFAVNVGIGCNIVAPWENRGTYQNITLKTYLCKEFFLNVGYQLRNFYQQSSLMLGVGCTI